MRINGFTLIEIIIVIAIVGIIASFGLFISMDFYRGYAFLSEQKIAVSVLQKARNQAMSNINQLPHGVHFESNKYVIYGCLNFVGCSDTQDIQLQPTMFIKPPPPADILFTQLSADSTATSFILSNGSKEATITVSNIHHYAFRCSS